MLITDAFIHHGMQQSDHIAVEFGASRYTYGQLLTAVQQVAFAVQARDRCPSVDGGLSKDSLSERWFKHSSRSGFSLRNQPCVALLISNRVEFLEVFLGTALAGGVAMVLNPDWPLAQIQRVLSRWAPDVLIAEAPILKRLGGDVSGEWDVPMKAIAVDASHSSPFLDYQDWKAESAESLPAIPHDNDIPFYIGFTSGTTGLPKGVIRCHASWVNSFRAGQVEFGFGADEQILVPGAFVHSLSLYSAVEALMHGATLHGLSAFTPKAVLQRLTNASITRLIAVPTLLSAIARAASLVRLTVPSIRTVISGGSKLSPSLRSQLHIIFPNACILEYYGASELSFISLASSAESVSAHSVGRPFHGVEVSVRRDDGTAVKPGDIGWIGIRSKMLCSGYLDATDGSGFRIEDGWATVGDRGWIDEAGYLYLAGRERDMLICNGINVYPSAIEAVLLAHPAIEEAVVIGLPDDCRGDLICAVLKMHTEIGLEQTQENLVQRNPASLNRAALIAYLKAHLESSKCPRRFFRIDTFPLTTSGKIKRLVLKSQILNGSLTGEMQ